MNKHIDNGGGKPFSGQKPTFSNECLKARFRDQKKVIFSKDKYSNRFILDIISIFYQLYVYVYFITYV